MFKKICYLIAISFAPILSLLIGVEYEIHDIGTLQTKSSQVIALNNHGQILGWYNIDGSKEGKYYFVRERNGSFHIISPVVGVDVEWRFLTDEGKVYGTNRLYDNTSNAILFLWDRDNGVVNLGYLPGRNIVAVNNNDQVLIATVSEIKDGKIVSFPAIWQNSMVTNLKGLQGSLGLESEQSSGIGINNNGDVIGNSKVDIVYKNNLYMKSTHAALWKDGKSVDLHSKFAKTKDSCAAAINDVGDILIMSSTLGGLYLDKNGTCLPLPTSFKRMNNLGYLYSQDEIYDVKKKEVIANLYHIDNQVKNDLDSKWWSIEPQIIKVNDNGEIIVNGKTIYGEDHGVLLKPIVKSE